MNHHIREDFPFFTFNRDVVYLDSAATTQKPQCVLERMAAYYAGENANIHRGSYPLSNASTRTYEQARADIAAFIGASAEQVVFTSGATDALNQAASLLDSVILPGSNVIATALEHHSALLPFMRLCQQKGAELRLLPLGEDGAPCLAQLPTLLDSHTAAAVITAAASATGWCTPLDQFLPVFAARKIPVVLDATQRIVHERLDFSTLNCDFLCFSGHKLYGPTGIGVLAMKEPWISRPPCRLGGGMVSSVRENCYIPLPGVAAHEAGTPPIAQAIGLQSAIHYLLDRTPDRLWAHENELTMNLVHELSCISGIQVVPAGAQRLPIVSFFSEALHSADMAHLLGAHGICCRAGQHCAHIAHQQLKEESTIRVSLGIYSNEEDICRLVAAVRKIQKRWGYRHAT